MKSQYFVPSFLAIILCRPIPLYNDCCVKNYLMREVHCKLTDFPKFIVKISFQWHASKIGPSKIGCTFWG
uniref:Uncharacterized protein n=1 Tax=Rhizophora mucronata TaxID=61149 RepID=A0A2P2J4G6_RHIMU